MNYDDHLNGLTNGISSMYDKYRDIDEDEILAGMTEEELAQLAAELDEEYNNPIEVRSSARAEPNYDLDEIYGGDVEDHEALMKFLEQDPSHRFERAIPDHIKYLMDPGSLRPDSPEVNLLKFNENMEENEVDQRDERDERNEGNDRNAFSEREAHNNIAYNNRDELNDSAFNEIEQMKNSYNPYRTQEQASSTNASKKSEMLARNTHSMLPVQDLRLKQVSTKEKVKYQNDPNLRFVPKLKKSKSPTRAITDNQRQNISSISEDELVNTNVPEEMVRRVALQDPTLTEINLNNIIGVPEELYLALCEALSKSTVVTRLFLANTGIKDRVAKAIAQLIRKNDLIQAVSVESNFITGDGAVAIVKALEYNKSVREIRIDNQRHIFGAKVEQEFSKRLKNNKTLTRFGYTFANAGLRMTSNNYITRNVDFVRKQRVASERASLLAGNKPINRVKPSCNRGPNNLPPQLYDMTLPKLHNSEDDEISQILGKLGNDEILKLKSWLHGKVTDPKKFNQNNGDEQDNSSECSGSKIINEPKQPKSTKKALFGDIKAGAALLKNVEQPKEQKIILPDPNLPNDEESKRGILGTGRYTSKGSDKYNSKSKSNPYYEVKMSNSGKYRDMNNGEYKDYSGFNN